MPSSGFVVMKRGEAVQLLREVLNACAGSLAISSVSLNEPNSGNSGIHSGGYQLQIGATLDDACRNCLMPLLAKRGLSMKESNGYLIVYRQ
jgi:hypothetical protein